MKQKKPNTHIYSSLSALVFTLGIENSYAKQRINNAHLNALTDAAIQGLYYVAYH